MGADKATVEIGGVAMARRVADALDRAGATSVCAVGGDAALLGASGLHVHADRRPGAGPLAAAVHALDVAGRTPVLAVLSCDLLRPDPAIIRTLVARRAEVDADVVVPVADQRPQWTHAVWHRRVAGVLERLLEAGERSIVGATAGLRTDLLPFHDAGGLRDADRPEDLPSRARWQVSTQGLRTIPAVDIPVVDVSTLSERIEAGAPVFDVREPDEYEEAHVPGVRLVPLAEVPDRVGEFPTDREVYVICRSGGRSAKAAEFLRTRGVDAVNVTGGTMAWIEAGHPVDRGV